MIIKKHIRSKTDEGINDYIEELENYILKLKASNTLSLIFKLDEINGTLVDDLDKVMNGEAVEYRVIDGETVEVSNLRVLHESSQNKTFDRIMTLYSKLKDLKSISDYVSALIPEVEEEATVVKEVVKVPEGVNMFEFAQKKATESKGK